MILPRSSCSSRHPTYLIGLVERARGIAAGLGAVAVGAEHLMAAILLGEPTGILDYMGWGPPRIDAAWEAVTQLAPATGQIARMVERP